MPVRNSRLSLLGKLQAAALTAALLFAPVARAEQAIALGGLDASETGYYAFAGLLKPLEGKFEPQNWLLRAWFDRLVYEVDDGERTVDAETWGGSLTLIRAFTLDQTRIGIGAGVEVRQKSYSKRTSLDDDGWRVRPRGELTIDQPLGDSLKLNLIGSLLGPDIDVFARGQLFYKTDWAGLELGPSVTWSSGEDYSSFRAGLAFDGLRLSDSLRMAGGTGAQWQDGKTHVYGVVTLIALFGF